MTQSFDLGSGDLRGGSLLRALLQSNELKALDTLATVAETQVLQDIRDRFDRVTRGLTSGHLARLLHEGTVGNDLCASPPPRRKKSRRGYAAHSKHHVERGEHRAHHRRRAPSHAGADFESSLLGALGNLPTQPDFGLGPGCAGDASAVLNDPSLTVEDKVTLMLMLIMKKMDKDIEREANHVNALQQQQNAGGGGQGGGAPSIDVETMKLKRLIDKRSQMFDMLRQIVDKYDQTAKGIIDSISR